MRVCLDQIYIYADCISLNFSLHFVTLFFHFFETEKRETLWAQKNTIQRREKKEYKFYVLVYHFLNTHSWYDIFFFRQDHCECSLDLWMKRKRFPFLIFLFLSFFLPFNGAGGRTESIVVWNPVGNTLISDQKIC